MRPVRLELEGFTSFREPTVVEFDDADYFAFVGPTGAGKSSLIDAMCFALYGTVPRYDDKRVVAPVITQGALEAKVRFDFSVDGTTYTAVRVVRSQGLNRATTKEARLEHDGDVLAGNADELSAEVERIIGLSFEHFTRCVVLPQGAFARFMHDTPGGRQQMLVELLNLRLYDSMRRAAHDRGQQLANKIGLTEQRIAEDLAHATPEVLSEAKERLGALGDLKDHADEILPRLAHISTELEALVETTSAAQNQIEMLERLQVPAPVVAQLDRLAHSRKLVAEAEAEDKRAHAVLKEAEAALAKLPERTPLERAQAGHARRIQLVTDLTANAKELDLLRTREAEAGEKLEAATAELVAAQAALDEARNEHAAAHLASGLAAGDPCPVCGQPVATKLKRSATPDLDRGEKKVTAANKKIDAARSTQAAQATEVARAAGTEAALTKDLKTCDAELKGAADTKEIDKTLAALDETSAAVTAARTGAEAAREERESTQAGLAELLEIDKQGRREFETRRDEIAVLTPPPVKGDDLAEDWTALADWARTKAADVTTATAEQRARMSELTAERDSSLASLTEACAEMDVSISGHDTIAEALVAATTDQARTVTELEAKIEQVRSLGEQIKQDKLDAEVAKSLSQHLSAKGFEKWIVNEALINLIVGASEILKELSNDQYSLALDDQGNFLVTDLHSAGETRSARTLSGGETFLASLALALALADQISLLAADGAAKLDAIFLDEGFGSLDSDALSLVADTVETLAAQGRTVGLITHVKELAERVPVRFQVSKDSRTSRVVRVEG